MAQTTDMAATGKAGERYAKFEATRRPFLDRAREFAALTIPMVMPREGMTGNSKYARPWSSLAARGVKNLAAKTVTALFPPNSPFWRYMLDEDARAKLESAQPGVKTQVEQALSKVERMLQDRFETSMIRPKLMEVALQGYVCGNVLVHVQEKGDGVRVFRLDSYVVKRDPVGNVLEILTKECISPMVLDPAIRELVSVTEKQDIEDNVYVYTWVKRENGKFTVSQEINGVTVPGSEGSYPIDECPWIALRLYPEDGSDYGRTYVEEHAGDITTYEALTKAITEAAAIAARMWFFLRPGSSIKKAVLEKTQNGGVVDGVASDVTTMQVNKGNDLQVPMQLLASKEKNLSFAFLLNSAVQRSGDRVTATEVQEVAQELDDVLGGIYSTWSNELQLPLVRIMLAQMRAEKILPNLPDNFAKPVPVTGLAALGRGNDFDKLRTYLGVLQETGFTAAVNQSEVATRAAISLGIDTDNLVKSPEQMQQEQMQQASLAAAQSAAPHVAQAAMAAPMDDGSGGQPGGQPQDAPQGA